MSLTPVEAWHYDVFSDGVVSCQLCPRTCFLQPGSIGACGARKNRDGALYALTYGQITGSAFDPMEKKPLYHFFPGRTILSIGGWGCNLKCVFCQNSPISQYESPTIPMSPEDLARICLSGDSVGIAYTYNEPLIAIEYITDCARAVRNAGGKNVLVTNGYVNPRPLDELLPFIDAMNIDVKGFNDDFYGRMCGGTLDPVLETVKAAVKKTHVELTTLLIPDENDAIPELEDLAGWIAENCGPSVPCHLTAYHPSYHYTKAATTAAHLKNARRIFRTRLNYVYLGNILEPGASDTLCVNCGYTVIGRRAFDADLSGITASGVCANCGASNNIVVL